MTVTNKYGWIQGNTVTSDTFKMQYYSTSDSFKGNVLVINNASTIDGKNINKFGSDGKTTGRFLEHSDWGANKPEPFKKLESDGCFVTSYANQQKLMNRLKDWSLYSGYQIGTSLVNRKYY